MKPEFQLILKKEDLGDSEPMSSSNCWEEFCLPTQGSQNSGQKKDKRATPLQGFFSPVCQFHSCVASQASNARWCSTHSEPQLPFIRENNGAAFQNQEVMIT